MHLFGKTKHIGNVDRRSVVQNSRSAHPSENLMLVRYNKLVIKICAPIQNRNKIHLEATV